MSKNISYTNEELEKFLNEFYEYFSDGFVFEKFLKVYLEKLDLSEVAVTQRTRDGGIDLTASKSSVGAFGNENFFVQAKRYKPTTTIGPEKIRALRGSMNTYGKGVFITTAKVSENTKADALNFDLSKPIIVIDGKELVSSCIDMEIGFVFKPVFSKSSMNHIMGNSVFVQNENTEHLPESPDETIEKVITANDIRARIISIPKFIMDKIPEGLEVIKVIVNNETEYELSVNRSRNYLARVTELFKKYECIDDEGTIFPKAAKWCINNENVISLQIR